MSPDRSKGFDESVMRGSFWRRLHGWLSSSPVACAPFLSKDFSMSCGAKHRLDDVTIMIKVYVELAVISFCAYQLHSKRPGLFALTAR